MLLVVRVAGKSIFRGLLGEFRDLWCSQAKFLPPGITQLYYYYQILFVYKSLTIGVYM